MALALEGRSLTPEEEYQIVNAIMGSSQVEILCLIDLLSKGCKIIIDNFAHLCGRVKSYDF